MMSGFVYLPSFDSPPLSDYLLHVGTDQDDNFKMCATLTLGAKVL